MLVLYVKVSVVHPHGTVSLQITFAWLGLRAVAMIFPGQHPPVTKLSTICKPRPLLAPVTRTVLQFLNALLMMRLKHLIYPFFRSGLCLSRQPAPLLRWSLSGLGRLSQTGTVALRNALR